MGLIGDPPFVLLDDARPGGGARLYRAPLAIVSAVSLDAVAPALDRLRDAGREGLHAAGFVSYEAAPAFDTLTALPPRPGLPLVWFGLFDRVEAIAGDDVDGWLPDPAGATAGPPEPAIGFSAYRARLQAVLDLIAAGDLYQANLTFPARVPFAGHPLALYAGLRARALAGHGAVVATGQHWLLSLSPESFFTVEGDTVTTRPMKGTAARDADPARDRAAALALAADPKQRAENLMIVDLLRNDLSRIAKPGTVRVPDRFVVEHYPTVHQMTSTVTAALAPGASAIDVLGALFPCGSVTGAPKIRASEAIAAIERAPRGSYTGAIGRFDPGGDAAFNVAIRTLEIAAGADAAVLGLGSGIVADSQPAGEWTECLAKGAFVTAGARAFDLIETMAFDPLTGIALLDRHLARMRASAQRLGFAFDRHAVRNALQSATFRLREPARVRLVLARSGSVAIGIGPLPERAAAPLRVALVPLPVDRDDFRLRHKTSDRAFYDAARRASGCDEVVFVGADGLVTEGSFTSVFVERGDGLLTPTVDGGLLPGVLRADLIARGVAREAALTPDDLSTGLLLGNALRGLMPARVAVANVTPATL